MVMLETAGGKKSHWQASTEPPTYQAFRMAEISVGEETEGHGLAVMSSLTELTEA